ncbi:DUF1345 domain-containing protein [Hymenobacter sp. BT770]|uniref:DUF1345 domain-containing protein n=1 Tax=Hymenobacter sp. BT770 TaxID=2886942 RepID=UPI001D10700F|nr:DUF1345 domain-containing protein [Hymenobacter sp. BT770]MCC3152185.1 DUF1345 domain-containing protein [Hymenobacter sp. BT770]MDO3413999.1 DUF1345 domain-containing protein [Hymenobacter sp. BT770]
MDIYTPSQPAVPMLLRLGLPARFLRVGLAMLMAGFCYWLAPPDFELVTSLLLGWDGFLVGILLLTWLTILQASTADIQRVARVLHPNRTWGLLLLVSFVGIATSLLAVTLLLRGLFTMDLEERLEHIMVSIVAVVGTWLMLHTLFALHYAHTYFCPERGVQPERQQGGLGFIGTPPTLYWDFVYFAFVIGMTAQTADVAVTSFRMRQMVLFHSMLSFGFNTAILALSINILAGLL